MREIAWPHERLRQGTANVARKQAIDFFAEQAHPLEATATEQK